LSNILADTFFSDGVLTPAQSVLGAIQGIKVAAPDISTSTIIGVSCTILVLLFAIQPFGTTKLATTFAPIVVVWLLFNFCCGIYNLALFDHSVLKAFNPYHAIQYLIRNGEEGWRSLGGLLLALYVLLIFNIHPGGRGKPEFSKQ